MVGSSMFGESLCIIYTATTALVEHTIIGLCFRCPPSRKQAATYLCPAIFPWVDMGPATEESGMVVLKLVGVFYVLIIVFDILLVFVSSESSTFVYVLLYALLIAVIVVLGAISRKPQNKWVPSANIYIITIYRYISI